MKDIHKAQWFKEAMVVPYTQLKGGFFSAQSQQVRRALD